MAEKRNHLAFDLADRTRSLAIVLLTERDDLLLRRPGEDLGVDLLVEIGRKRQRPLRRFGVILRGRWSAVTLPRVNTALTKEMRSLLSTGPHSIPVCILFFVMEGDQGYYTWLVEPVVTAEGRPKLQSHSTPDCKPLDRDALDDIVERVDAWYDAFFAEIAV